MRKKREPKPGPREPLRGVFLCVLCAFVASLLFVSCSQNSFGPEKPAPQAPKDARVAQPVQKDAGGGAAMAPAPEPQPAPAPGEGSIEGTVQLPEALKGKFKPGATLFIIARSAGGSMPVAAQKNRVESFPFSFRIGAQDSMVGEALPQETELLVRLDQDGDITTRTPGDLVAGPLPASLGQSVTLTLEESEK